MYVIKYKENILDSMGVLQGKAAELLQSSWKEIGVQTGRKNLKLALNSWGHNITGTIVTCVGNQLEIVFLPTAIATLATFKIIH